MRISIRNLVFLLLASTASHQSNTNGSVVAFQLQRPTGHHHNQNNINTKFHTTNKPTSLTALSVAAPIQGNSGSEVGTENKNKKQYGGGGGGNKQQQSREKKNNKKNSSRSRRWVQQQQQRPKQKKHNQRDEKKEFTWLYWLYKQWHDSPVSHVEESILQQFLPAAQCWKNKQSWLGARRATELVERYCIEYLAGNDYAPIQVSASILMIASDSSSTTKDGQQRQQQQQQSQTYFAKLLRAGLDAWLSCVDESEPVQKAHNLLDNLMILADRAIHESNNNSETVTRAKILQSQIQEHRIYIQEKESKSSSNTNDYNNNNSYDSAAVSSSSSAGDQLSDLLTKALSFLRGGTSRHLEDSLVSMQQIVISLDKMVSERDADLIDAFERELVFTIPEQEHLIKSSEWLSVALPFWEFLHHSVIRGLLAVNEQERAERSLQQMQEILRTSSTTTHQSTTTEMTVSSSARVASLSLERIMAMDDEGKDLRKHIRRDKQFQWLHWLSHQLSVSPVGEVSDSVLKLVMPAMSMHAKRKTTKDAKQAEELLNRYVEEFKAGNPKAILTNNYFNCVCDAWAKLGDPKRAQEILEGMVQLQGEYPENARNLRTDVYSLSTLAAAWANKKSPDAAKKAEEILHRMEDSGMNPSTITYNTVLRALIHSPGVNKAMRAEEIIKRMEQRYEAGHSECKPSIRTYQSLISAWSRTDLSGTAQKAEQVLDFLDSKSQEKGFSYLSPNAHCFAAAIHGWAYSQEEQKARRAYNILSHMRDLYEQQGEKDCEPNVVVYTSVINACACPCLESEKEEAFQIAQLAMDELCYNRRYGHPNFLSFAAFLRVCETTLEPGPARDETIRSVFAKCCEAGQVAEVVIDKLKRAASEELYQELITNAGAETSDGNLKLPRGWTRRLEGDQGKSRSKPIRHKHRPEYRRLRKVRMLSGKSGRYSRGKGEDSISFTIKGGF